jgi:hypothetical protein
MVKTDPQRDADSKVSSWAPDYLDEMIEFTMEQHNAFHSRFMKVAPEWNENPKNEYPEEGQDALSGIIQFIQLRQRFYNDVRLFAENRAELRAEFVQKEAMEEMVGQLISHLRAAFQETLSPEMQANVSKQLDSACETVVEQYRLRRWRARA